MAMINSACSQGAANNHDDAVLVRYYLQNESLDVFIKPYVLPAVSGIPWAGSKGDQIQGYIEKGRNLVSMILDLTSSGLNETNAAIARPDMEQLQQAHKLWTESANILLEDASEKMKPLLQTMNTSLNSAIKTLEQYDKSPSDVYLWQAQSAASNHIIAEMDFITLSNSI